MASIFEPKLVAVHDGAVDAKELFQLLDVQLGRSGVIIGNASPILCWLDDLGWEAGIILDETRFAVHASGKGVQRVNITRKVTSHVEWSEVSVDVIGTVHRSTYAVETVQGRRVAHC